MPSRPITGPQIGSDSIRDLADGAVTLEELGLEASLNDAVRNLEGPIRWDHLRARKMGPFVALSFNLYMPPSMTVAVSEQVLHL